MLLWKILCVLVYAMMTTRISGQQAGAYSESDTTLAKEHFSKAIKHFIAAKYDSSIYCFSQTAAIYSSLAERYERTQFWERVMKCKINIGEVSRVQGDYVRAIRFGSEALELGLQRFGESHPDVNKCYNNLGIVYCERADFALGLQSLNRALALKKHLYGETSADVAITYNSIGSAYHDKGDLEKAVEYYARALAIRQAKLTETDPYLAFSYSNIASVNHLKGDYEQALSLYTKALAILKSAYEENNPTIANCYNDMGAVYHESGDYEKASLHHLRALAILKNTLGEKHHSVAETYEKIGNVYLEQGSFQEAEQIYQQSVALFQETYGGEHPAIATGYNKIGQALMNLAKGEHALAYFGKSLALWRKIHGEVHPGTAKAYYSLASWHLRLGNFEGAAFNVQRAIKSLVASFTSDRIEDNPEFSELSSASSTIDLLNTLELKASILLGFNDGSSNQERLQFALSTYEAISGLIDRLRSDYRAEGSKLFLGARTHQLYENAIETALELYTITEEERFKSKAFYFAQKGKASVLTLALQESLARNFANIPDSLVEREKQIRINLAFYETAVQKERFKTDYRDSLRIKELERRRFSVKQSYDTMINRFEKVYPEYYDLKYAAKPATLAELQNSLNERTVLFEYFSGGKSLYAFAVTNTDFSFFSTPRDSSFDSILKSLAVSFNSVTSKEAYSRSAATLYGILIKPLNATTTSKTKLVIVPDGELHQIPFEALLTANPEIKESYSTWPYLIKEFEIAYQPSAALYLRSLDKAPLDHVENEFAGFAPVFKNNGNLQTLSESPFSLQRLKAFWQTVMRDSENLQELKFSEGEVKEIGGMFADEQRQLFLNEDASEKNFKANSRRSRFVHIATHGLLKDESPKLSGLAFTQHQIPSNAKEDDGFLYTSETYNLDLNADLVVLSACQSGTGKIARGEGLMALTRGFLYSGARNIIASLWKVFDQHTSQMMVDLYRQILSGKSYSAALREAKLKMIANPETAGPQSWAAFILIGG